MSSGRTGQHPWTNQMFLNEQWNCCQAPSNVTGGVALTPRLKCHTIVTFSFVLASVISLGPTLDPGYVDVVSTPFAGTTTQLHCPH